MGWLTAIGGAFRVIGEFLGLISKRSDLANTPEMKKAAEAQKGQNEQDAIQKEIRDNDLDALRRRLSH